MTRTSKLTIAGALVAFAFGGVAIGVAWATAGSGITTTIIAGPTQLGEIDLSSESDINEL